jgi:uncharacterized protein (DUF1330 family)
MPALIVFMRDRVRDKAEFDVYSGLAGATLAGHTVKPLVAYNRCETLEGAPTEGAVILEFPSVDAAKAWYDSPAYREVREHRFKSADYRVFVTEML